MTGENGAFPSKEDLKELRKQARQARWKEGAKDTALLKDISDTENAFQSADAETAGRIDS